MSLNKVTVETLEYCRICLRKIPRLAAINQEIEENFFLVTQVELITSPCLSHLICTLCERKIKTARSVRDELIENETNLRRELGNFSPPAKEESPHLDFVLEIEKISPRISPSKSNSAKITCEHCNKPVVRNYYQHHIQRLHLGIKNFACDKCGKSFFKKSSLVSHMLVHLDSRPFVCSYAACTKSFLSATALATHVRFHHTSFSGCVCEACGKGFKQRRLLEEHVRSKHTGERAFKCPHEGCNSAYFSMSAVRKHLRRHEVESVACEQCGKVCRGVSTLQAHVRLSHSTIEYVCEVEGCGKSFGSKCFLHNHLKAHARRQKENS